MSYTQGTASFRSYVMLKWPKSLTEALLFPIFTCAHQAESQLRRSATEYAKRDHIIKARLYSFFF